MSLQLPNGSIFASRYRVIRSIAIGGMGAVYEAQHLETHRHLALKVMLPHIVQSTDMRDRFRREARVAAHIESEHIVAVFDAGVDDPTGMPFMVMELLRGEELSKGLERIGRYSPQDVATYLHQVALALDKTHRAFIVHRDLKPENLFLTHREDGQPRIKVLDFGIAKLLAESATQDQQTRNLGTPLYMAPEQFRSGQPISTTTDIYALGMIAFTLLVGGSYWAEEAESCSNVYMFASTVSAGPKELPTVRAHKRGVRLPAAFDAWFARATAVAPADRFPSALSAVMTLADALEVPRPGAPSGMRGSLPQSAPLRISAADSEIDSDDVLPTTLYQGNGVNSGATPPQLDLVPVTPYRAPQPSAPSAGVNGAPPALATPLALSPAPPSAPLAKTAVPAGTTPSSGQWDRRLAVALVLGIVVGAILLILAIALLQRSSPKAQPEQPKASALHLEPNVGRSVALDRT